MENGQARSRMLHLCEGCCCQSPCISGARHCSSGLEPPCPPPGTQGLVTPPGLRSVSSFWPESLVHLTIPVHFSKCSRHCLLHAAPALLCCCPFGALISGVGPAHASWESTAHASSQFCVQSHQVGSLKWAMVEVHTMGKSRHYKSGFGECPLSARLGLKQ